MKVLVLSDGVFTEREIDNTLEALQEIVGGYIEIPFISHTLSENGIDIIINEEGKMLDECKPEIIMINKETQTILDVIMGNCIFASHDEEGETTSLSEEQIKIVKDVFKLDVILSYEDSREKRIVKGLLR